MSRGRALIVDDSPTARVLLSRMLERLELSTLGAGSAEDALNLLRHERPDLIFLDHMLPGMDGFEALQELKSQPHTRDIPVIMYTSQHAERYLEEARAKGAAGVIGKQIDREQLRSQLENILHAREASRAETKPEYHIPEDAPRIALASHVSQPVDTTATITTTATVADALITPLGVDDAPSLIESVQWRKLTGRMSVLENAWQESQDEVHRLRQEVSELQLQHQQELDRRSRRTRWISVTLMVAVLGLMGSVWHQLDSLAHLLGTVSNQSAIMKDVLTQLMTLIDR